MRNRSIWLAVIAVLIAIAGWPAESGESEHAAFTVDNLRDAGDEVPGDGACATFLGECTLRAAIQEANAHAGHDTIYVPGRYVYADDRGARRG